MKVFLLLICILAFGCSQPEQQPVGYVDGVPYFSWHTYYDKKLSTAKGPVKLIGKEKSFGLYGVTLLCADGEIITIGNMIPIANNIGVSHEIGDTIK